MQHAILHVVWGYNTPEWVSVFGSAYQGVG